MTEVVAKIGGGHIRGGEERRFLVASNEYAGRGRFGFVIDLARHAEYDLSLIHISEPTRPY